MRCGISGTRFLRALAKAPRALLWQQQARLREAVGWCSGAVSPMHPTCSPDAPQYPNLFGFRFG